MSDSLCHSTPAQGRTDIDPSKYVPQGMTQKRKQDLDHMADKEYFNAVLNMTPEIRSALMASEQERIRTFSARWPIEDIIKGVDIAKEGFFYTGNADRVECAFCRGVLRNWERGDDPRTLHKDNFTYCSFAQGRESSNIPARKGFLWQLMRITRFVNGADRNNQRVGDLGINITEPDNFQFSIENVRRKSFINFPSNCPVNPADLAEAGFYYSGDGDQVKCFFCAGILGRWMVGDQPWTEHAKWFPGCAFVLQQKGWSYVRRIGESMTPEEKKMSGEYDYNSMSASNLAGDLGMNTSLPDNVQFAAENVRKKSFVNFPSHCPVNSADLAQAGFYYTGDGDRVKCFLCGGVLGSWTSSDQPWVRHVKCFPCCPLVVLQNESIREKMSRKRRYEAQRDPDHINGASGRIPAMQYVFNESEQEEMGTSYTHGCMEDVKGVMNIEDIHPSIGQDDSAPSEQRSFDVQEVYRSHPVAKQSITLQDIISNPNELSLEESLLLIEMSRCRTCKKNQVGSVILPCGCFVLCHLCAVLEALPRKCPKCSGEVRGAVRITLA